GRSLLRIASSAPIVAANFLFSFTRPASGETTTRSSSPWSAKFFVRIHMAVMWSHGFWKKPWIWPEWRSIVRIRSIPAVSSMRATRRGGAGPRGGGEDRRRRGGLFFLGRVAVPRADGDHAVRGAADGRVDELHQLHQRVVG